MSDLGNKAIMAKNILYYMDKYDKSRSDMCKALDVKYTTFTDWIKGNTYPRIDKIELMANYFGVSKADLVEDRADRKQRGKIINVLGRVAAGIPIEAVEEVIDTEEITEEMASHGKYFGLLIKGDSMLPAICDQDVVIVRQQDDAESGDTVIALVNGDDATCKRLRKYKEGIELIPNNPSFSPMFFTNEDIQSKPVKIIGKVVELRRKF